MSEYHVVRTARLTDSQVLDLIDSLKSNIGVTSGSIRLGGGMRVDIMASERSEEPLSAFDHERRAIRTAHVSTAKGIHIDFYRGTCADAQQPATNRQASPYFDELFMRAEGEHGVEAAQDWVKCIDAIEKALPSTYPLQDSGKATDAIDVLRDEIAQLSGQYRQMLVGLAEERGEFRKQAEEDRETARLEKIHEQLELSNSLKRQQKEFDNYKVEEEAKLKQKQEELGRREKELDNRQHMHARRNLREKMVENFRTRTSRPAVSKSASWMRWLVFVFTLMVGVCLTSFAVFSFDKLIVAASGDGTDGWLTAAYAVRSVILVALALGFIAYAINWLRSMYLDDVRAERRYEKHGHDIDRASFVIETIMEVGDKENMQVPDAWIDGVCRNLFHDSADKNQDNSPSNALAALFETVAGAKLGPDGAELSMKRRDARRFAKKISSD